MPVGGCTCRRSTIRSIQPTSALCGCCLNQLCDCSVLMPAFYLYHLKILAGCAWRCRRPVVSCIRQFWPWRSEEHTSELQSLMRISYAVFCLKKNNNKHNH